MSYADQFENVVILVTVVGVLAGLLIGYTVWGGRPAIDPSSEVMKGRT